MKRFFTLILPFFIGACASTGKYDQQVQQWVGKSSSELTASWGQPTTQVSAPDSTTVLVYEKTREVERKTTTSMGYQGGTGMASGSIPVSADVKIVKKTCKTFFQVNPQNKITKVEWSGNDCLK